MAKETLIDMVQDLLAEADGDDVNSISDTVESDQAARVIQTCFDNMVDGGDIKHHESIVHLTATDATTPNVMTRPEGLYDIQWVQYNIKPTAAGDQKYGLIDYVTPKEFFDRTSKRTASATNVTEVTLASGHEIMCLNDRAPTMYTLLEDYDTFIFDNYDSVVEAFLQNSKSLAYGRIKPTLALSDTATPDLPKNLFNQLKNEARALYFDLYKDGVTSEIDRLRRRSEVHMQRDRHITKYGERSKTGPDYGRKPRG